MMNNFDIAKWVPKQLSMVQEEQRTSISLKYLLRYQTEKNLDCISHARIETTIVSVEAYLFSIRKKI
ncbi:hypothetical protein PGB90_005066 [Kerria lacca]